MTTHLLDPDRIATLLYPDMDILHVGYYYDKNGKNNHNRSINF